MPMKVKVKLQDIKYNRTCIVTSGWKPFAKKYNLQVGNVCKFVMTQLQPLSFTITITQAKGFSFLLSRFIYYYYLKKLIFSLKYDSLDLIFSNSIEQ